MELNIRQIFWATRLSDSLKQGTLFFVERGVRELCGIEPIGQGSATDEQTDRLWEAVKKVPHFYLKLEPVKGAAKLFNEVRAKFKENC